MKKAYPVYDQHYHDSLATTRIFWQRLKICKPSAETGCIAATITGSLDAHRRFCSTKYLRETYDVWAVNVEKEYHEDGEHESTATGSG
ncbi:MAG: hypothetical protein R3C26_14880 [Calditrichia bacterium]